MLPATNKSDEYYHRPNIWQILAKSLVEKVLRLF